MTAYQINDLVDESAYLVSPPDIWVRINEVVHDPGSSVTDVANITMQDTVLTAKVLKIVNSSLYNFQSKVDTVSRAIAIIGLNDLFSLVTAVAAAKVFTSIPTQVIRTTTFWRHSVCTAIVSRRLAKQCGVLHPERLYVAGLLHDIGSLILYGKYPEVSTDNLMASSGDEEVLTQLEQESFGFDHAQLGADLMSLWKLPKTLTDIIRYHHQPGEAGNAMLDCALVHLANVICNRREISCFMEGEAADDGRPDELVWRITGFEHDILDTVVEGLDEELEQAMSILMPKIAKE